MTEQNKPFLADQDISRSCSLPDRSAFQVETRPAVHGHVAEMILSFSGRQITLDLDTTEKIGAALDLLANMESVVHDALEFIHRESLCFDPEPTWGSVMRDASRLAGLTDEQEP